jgi:glutamate-ammonia-ligase adenylyltransferase
LFRWLSTSDSLVHPRSGRFFATETQRALRIFQKPERKLDALRRLYRRELLRIGARDILGEGNLQTVTAELSLLADAMVEACLRIAAQQLTERFTQPPATPHVVIALGKHGGAELNYSSDIDLMLAYRDEGECEDARGKRVTYLEYFHALSEKLIHNLSYNSGEGHLYRVDFRLRPEGRMSPLARSVESYLLYYESRGELWERQMLMKARPVAGDLAFGAEFLKQLEPFIYPRTFFQNPTEYIARIKARIEASIGREENVKLRAGGIRDIEFIVQALQLVNGGKHPDIRSATTLDAIANLAAAHFLRHEEETLLTDAYVFFRTIEHRLQTMLNTQTHEMPTTEADLTSLAKRIGLRSAQELRDKYERSLAGVRTIFDGVFAVPHHASLFTGEVSDSVLARCGLKDLKKGRKHLAAMNAWTAFQPIAETLLGEIAKTISPDMTLHNVAAIAGAQKFPDQFFHQLTEENFRRMLLTVCAISPRFAKGLAQHPLVIDLLAHDHHAFDAAAAPDLSKSRSLLDAKNEHELRIGVRYVLGVSSFDEMAGELSRLADAVVRHVADAELRTARANGLALFALGKYGTNELNFDSDLDMLFISETKSAATKAKLEKVATRFVQRLSSPGDGGKLYDVDARLRPEGKSAPLVVERKAFLAYLKSRASLWERQSLTRLRFVAGDEKRGAGVVNAVHAFVYESPLPKGWAQEIVAMRKKTETRSKVSGSNLLDVKLSAGGMVDIEFLAQMMQLKFGTKEKALRGLATVEAIRNAPLAIPKDELVDAYMLYRNIETHLRIVLEERGTVVPEGEKLELLAKLLGFSDGQTLHRHLLLTMKNIRQIFLKSAEQL